MKEEIEYKLTGTSINDWTITDYIVLMLTLMAVIIVIIAIVAAVKRKNASFDDSVTDEDDQLDTVTHISTMTNIDTVKTNIETITNNINLNH